MAIALKVLNWCETLFYLKTRAKVYKITIVELFIVVWDEDGWQAKPGDIDVNNSLQDRNELIRVSLLAYNKFTNKFLNVI